MKIGVQLDRDDFKYDLHSLVKSFYPDDEVTIFTIDEEEKAHEAYEILFEIEIPEYEERKEAKDRLKREVYRLLTDLNGTGLPWGTLSGIRPTKIPLSMMDEASRRLNLDARQTVAHKEVRREIQTYMKDTYYTSQEKIDLALQVAGKEHVLLEQLKLHPKSYSLYVNIPFCPSICLYCTFASSPIHIWQKRIDAYLDQVIAEMKETHANLVSQGYEPGPTTIYIGGGTPTTLTPPQMDRLLSAIEEIWDFSRMVEFTVEAGRPDSFTPEILEVLKEHGIHRISVNPQTMNQKTLDVIGRGHTVEETKEAFRMAREAGFDNINMDIILGLPGEEEEDVLHTLEEIEALRPDSLTVHSLAVKRASRLKRSLVEEQLSSPSARVDRYEGMAFENSGELMAHASASASSMDMEPYYLYRQKNMRGNLENTGFAVKGKECLYNILIMEEKESILAFGAGGSTKRIFEDGRIERLVSPKNIDVYEERLPELVEKKEKLFAQS